MWHVANGQPPCTGRCWCYIILQISKRKRKKWQPHSSIETNLTYPLGHKATIFASPRSKCSCPGQLDLCLFLPCLHFSFFKKDGFHKKNWNKTRAILQGQQGWLLKELCHCYCACLHLTDANDVNKAMFIWAHVTSRLALRNLHRDSLFSLEPFAKMSLSSKQSSSFAVCIRVSI